MIASCHIRFIQLFRQLISRDKRVDKKKEVAIDS